MIGRIAEDSMHMLMGTRSATPILSVFSGDLGLGL
jgi:hypothetical protein